MEINLKKKKKKNKEKKKKIFLFLCIVNCSVKNGVIDLEFSFW